MAAVMLFLRQTTGKTERYTHFCMSLKPVFTRDCGNGVHFIDEPMNGLDREGIKLVKELLQELREKGKTILLSSHYAEDVDICDMVYEMEHGELREHKRNSIG